MNQKEYIISDGKIIFSDNFNKSLNDYTKFMFNVSTIYLGLKYNQELSRIPPNIKQIVFGKKFNKNLDDLPDTLESIIFVSNSEYYYPLNQLNNNIKEIILPDNYDTKIKKFPYYLSYLKLGKNYIYEIDEFPPNLKYLDIGESYEYPLTNLPNELETLVIGGKFNLQINYPVGLKYFTISDNCLFSYPLDILPPTLVYLHIDSYYLPIEKLPDSLLCISFGDNYDGQIINFPPQITKFKFSKKFKYHFNEIPYTVKKIQLYQSYPYFNEIVFKFSHIEFDLIK